MVPAPIPEKNFVPTSFKGFVKTPPVTSSDQHFLLPSKTSSPPTRFTQESPVKAVVRPSPVKDMKKASILPTRGNSSTTTPNKSLTLEKVAPPTPVKDASVKRIPAKERLGVKGFVTPVKPIKKNSPSKSPPYGVGNSTSF